MIPYQVIDKISLGPITIYTWGLLVGLGFLLAWLWALYQAKKYKFDPGKITNLVFLIVGGAVLGARLLFVLENYELFVGDFWGIFKLWQGGMSYYGGFIGGVLAALIYLKQAKLEIKKVLDILAQSTALGIAVGRIGCFLINDHLGGITSLPWGIRHLDQSVRHPVALYLSLSGLLCFIFLIIIKRYIKTKGLLLCLFLFWYGLLRFLLDFTRSKETHLPFTDKHYLGLTLSQYISIGVFLVAIGLFLSWKAKRKVTKAKQQLTF